MFGSADEVADPCFSTPKRSVLMSSQAVINGSTSMNSSDMSI
jgi:hypothetical protein